MSDHPARLRIDSTGNMAAELKQLNARCRIICALRKLTGSIPNRPLDILRLRQALFNFLANPLPYLIPPSKVV